MSKEKLLINLRLGIMQEKKEASYQNLKDKGKFH